MRAPPLPAMHAGERVLTAEDSATDDMRVRVERTEIDMPKISVGGDKIAQ